jgi:hypothetical protein
VLSDRKEFGGVTDQQIIRERHQAELSKILMRAIAQYADDNVDAIPKVDDGDVFGALMNNIIELLAFTSEYNRAQSLRLFGPEVSREVERCSLHYARPRGAA